MTKQQFYDVFENVVNTSSYREKGVYHYSTIPRKAMQFLAGGENSVNNVAPNAKSHDIGHTGSRLSAAETAQVDDYSCHDANIQKLRTGIKEDGARVVSLVSAINERSERLNKLPIFKQTTNTLAIMGHLPTHIANNKAEFIEWNRLTWMLFYESCGGKDATYPVVNRNHPEFDVRWDINKLRNDFQHDLRGTSELAEPVYRKVLGKSCPTTDLEWTAVQKVIMGRVVRWLDEVLKILNQQITSK